MDLVRAGLGYLAQQDVASLPTVTQARLLRELERAESQHTAARARVLSVFDGQWGFRDDGHGGPHPWLTWQTRVTGKAASGAVGWMRRLQAHPVVGDALAAGTVSASYARKICEWAGMLPVMLRDAGAQILVDAAAGGAGLDDLSGMAEDMFSRCAPPDRDVDDDARFGDRFFRLTRLFQGHGRADGDLTPECLAALTEVLDTLGKKGGPEDRRSAGQRGHDALEEAMRLLLASGCLPERAGQPAQVQLHLGLDELLSMPGAAQAARAWLEAHLGTPTGADPPASERGGADQPAGDQPAGDPPGGDPPASEPGVAKQPGSDPGSGDPPGGEPGGDDPSASERGVADQAEGEPGGKPPGGEPPGGEPCGGGGPGPGSARPGEGSPFWPDPQDLFSWPDPRAARRFAAGTGEPGWLTGKAAEAYSCDAKIAPMVCGHLDRNALARAVTAFLAGDLANLVTDADPVPVPGPRCQCDEHPAPSRAAMPGALPSTSQPGQPAASRDSLTPGGLARLQDTLLRYAVSLLSGPAGLAAYLRTQLTGGFFPSPSLPLDLGEPTEQVPPHLRRAVIKRDRHCRFPGCAAPPVRCHVHHLIPRSKGGPTRLDNLTLLCHFHHLVVIHRWGWALTLHADGTTTAKSPDGIRTLHSHGPPPGQDTLWADRPGHGPPATAA